MITLIKGPPG